MKLFKMLLICLVVFSSVAFAQAPDAITSAQLVGEWTCRSFSTPRLITNPNIADEWEVDSEGLVAYFFGGTITFQDDGDGTYSTSLDGQCPFYMSTTNTSVECPYKVINNILFIECAYFFVGSPRTFQSIYTIEMVTNNKYVFKLMYSSSFASKIVEAERVLGPQ